MHAGAHRLEQRHDLRQAHRAGRHGARLLARRVANERRAPVHRVRRDAEPERAPENVRHREHRAARDVVVAVGQDLIAPSRAPRGRSRAARAAEAERVPAASSASASSSPCAPTTRTWSLGGESRMRRAVTRMASACSPYEITGACFSSLNPSPSRSTAQTLGRTSPPTFDLRRRRREQRLLLTSSRRYARRTRDSRVPHDAATWIWCIANTIAVRAQC